MPQFDAFLNGLADLGAAPADDDMLLVVDTSDTSGDAGGTPKRVSAANLLGGGGSELWLGPDRFTSAGGSAATGFTGGNAVWAFDAASAELIACVLGDLPAGWSTYDVDLWWTNGAAGSGDVVWQFSRASYGDGEALNSMATVTAVTATAPAQNIVEVTTIASGVAVPSAGQIAAIRVGRVAADAADTLANDAWLNAVVLRKAS